MQKRLLRLLFAVAVASLFLMASAQGGRELIIAQGIDIPGFDVHDHSNTAVEAVHVNLFDYLLMRDAEGVWQPALATSWEPISDTAWRFHLREGVLWHDGAPFNAEDVKFTLERVANDETLREHFNYRQIRDVEIINDFEVLIHTEGPDPLLLNRLSRIGSSILPKHYIEEVGWESFSVRPIGTGPFKFVSWQRDDRLVLEAFDAHWRGRPAWDTLVHRSIPEDATRVGELLTGGVHIITNVPTQDAERVAVSPVARVAPWPTARVMFFVVNTAEDKATGDPRVREAIDYAIDNQLLIDVLMGGLGTPTRGLVAPGISAAPMELYDTYLYDPERAVELLQEAGYGPGELTITLQGPAGRYPQDAEILELVGAMLEAVGVGVRLEALEWSAYQSRVWSVNMVENLGLIGLGNSMMDAWLGLSVLSCGGSYAERSNWCNARYDALVYEAEVELDPERRAELIREGFHIIADERPLIFLFNSTGLAGINENVAWSPRPDELLWMFDARPSD